MNEETKNTAYHWLCVGYVSEGAKAWIEEAGGQVKHLQSNPSLIGVALAYNPAGTWVWSKGRQQYRQGIEFWTTGEIQEASTGITLQYGSSSDPSTPAEYCSMETNYLILPDETFETETHQAIKTSQTASIIDAPEYDLGDLEESPF